MEFRGGKYVDEGARLAKAFRRAAHQALRRLGFLIRGTAQKLIPDAPGPGPVGGPPHTHTQGKKTKSGRGSKKGVLPGSILYAEVDEMSIIAGPSQKLAGTVGAAFEHEGTVSFRGEQYKSRPFMTLALKQEIGKLPGILGEQYAKVE